MEDFVKIYAGQGLLSTCQDIRREYVLTKQLQERERYLEQLNQSDNGIGFDQKYSSKIFELFQRLHSKIVYSGLGSDWRFAKKSFSIIMFITR